MYFKNNNESACDSPSESDRSDSSSLRYTILTCRVVKVFFRILHIFGHVFNTGFTLFAGLGLVFVIVNFTLLVGTMRIWTTFLVKIVALFIFPVGLVIRLRITTITIYLGEGVSL